MLAYRRDLDGLRGFAVLLVMAYHFNLPYMVGGYIGVDIFFVVSGYLITSLLIQESEILSPLPGFYIRRIRRLMPAFLVFAVITTLMAAVLLLPKDFIDFLHSLYYGLLLKANSYFDTTTKDYFAPNSQQIPLLHIWSLSIEWQFYLIFPLLFLIANKYLSRPVLYVVLLLTVILLTTVSSHETGVSEHAYFYTSARFFELLLGCLMTITTIRINPRMSSVLVYAALAMLMTLSMKFTHKTPYPGIHALEICLLSALVIVFGTNNRLLTYPLLVHIGRLSYSAYLWHWPFVAFLTYLQIPITASLGTGLLLSVLLLAHISYIFVEQPGRQIPFGIKKMILLFMVVPCLISLTLWRVAIVHHGWFWRLGAEATSVYNKMEPYYTTKSQLNCLRIPGQGGDDYECHFGDPTSTVVLYLIGDSHAGAYRWFVQQLALQAHLNAISYSFSECLMLPGAQNDFGSLSLDARKHNLRCNEGIQNIFTRIYRDRPKYVLIAERWIGYPDKQLDHLQKTITTLMSRGITPILLASVPENGTNIKDCYYRHIKLREAYTGECSIKEHNPFAEASKMQVDRLFETLKKKYPSLIIINERKAQCASGSCDVVIDGAPIYADSHHLNDYGSAILGKIYLSRYGNPLAD